MMGREYELEILEREYEKDGASFIVLYGQRIIGKTELLLKFIEARKSIYFLATPESEARNIEAFGKVLNKFYEDNSVKQKASNEWKALWKDICLYKSKKKLIIVIDEFQHLWKVNQKFPKLVKKMLNAGIENLNDTNVMIIFCGSFTSLDIITKGTYVDCLTNKAIIKIKSTQIRYSSYCNFFRGKSSNEIMEYYALTGGIKRYINIFSKGKDIYLDIEKNILSKYGVFYNEVYSIFQRKCMNIGITDIAIYLSILSIVAKGNSRLPDMLSVLNLNMTELKKHLKVLINLEIIEKVYLVNIDYIKTRKIEGVLYKIKDNFFLFWFKFVYPYASFLETRNKAYVMDIIKQNYVSEHVEYVYKSICKEKLEDYNKENMFGLNFDKIGTWWNHSLEIDLVAFDSQGRDIIFGECRYMSKKIGMEVLVRLERKAKLVLWKNEDRKEHFIIFSAGGFSNELLRVAEIRKDVMLVE